MVHHQLVIDRHELGTVVQERLTVNRYSGSEFAFGGAAQSTLMSMMSARTVLGLRVSCTEKKEAVARVITNSDTDPLHDQTLPVHNFGALCGAGARVCLHAIMSLTVVSLQVSCGLRRHVLSSFVINTIKFCFSAEDENELVSSVVASKACRGSNDLSTLASHHVFWCWRCAGWWLVPLWS